MSTETAQVIPLFPTGEVADETVRATIRSLIEGRKLLVEDVAAAVGMKRSTLYSRLKGWGSQQSFSAGEVASLARYFRVPIERIYDGLGGAFVPPTDPDGSLSGGVGVGPAGLEPTTSAV